MNKDKLVHQLFIGKVSDVIGNEKTRTLLKEAKEAFDIPVVVGSLSKEENHFLHQILIDKKLEKDEQGRYKIVKHPEQDKMLVEITRKLIYA